MRNTCIVNLLNLVLGTTNDFYIAYLATKNVNTQGGFVIYEIDNVDSSTSFLEMLTGVVLVLALKIYHYKILQG